MRFYTLLLTSCFLSDCVYITATCDIVNVHRVSVRGMLINFAKVDKRTVGIEHPCVRCLEI